MIVELPKDAEGREIPLDTETLYDKDGKEIEVSCYQYYPKVAGHWNIKSVLNKYYRQNEVYLTKPDSWEKLLDDLDKAASKTYCGTCTYFGKNPTDCDTCSIGDISACDSAAMRDIASRIRKLRGEGDV